MGDMENEEIIDGPRVADCLEFGGIPDNPRTTDKFWYRAFLSDSEPDEGLVIKVSRRPRTRRGEDPHPTLRLMRENPAGMLFARIKSGQVRVENYYDFTNRMTLMRIDEELKNQKKNRNKDSGNAAEGSANLKQDSASVANVNLKNSSKGRRGWWW